MEVTDPDGTVHRFWPVHDPGAVRAVQEALADREILIADGHHRYETALAYREEQGARDGEPEGDRPYDFILMYLANLHGEGLALYPTHRVVMAAREVDARFMSAFQLTRAGGWHQPGGGRAAAQRGAAADGRVRALARA